MKKRPRITPGQKRYVRIDHRTLIEVGPGKTDEEAKSDYHRKHPNIKIR